MNQAKKLKKAYKALENEYKRQSKKIGELEVELNAERQKNQDKENLFTLYTAAYLDFKRKWLDAIELHESRFYHSDGGQT